MYAPRLSPRTRQTYRVMAALPGCGSHIKGRACPYRSREMSAPCGLLAAKRNQEGTESAKKRHERNPSQPPGGVKRQGDASAAIRKGSFLPGEALGMGKKHTPLKVAGR